MEDTTYFFMGHKIAYDFQQMVRRLRQFNAHLDRLTPAEKAAQKALFLQKIDEQVSKMSEVKSFVEGL